MRRHIAKISQAVASVNPPEGRASRRETSYNLIDAEAEELRGTKHRVDELTSVLLVIDKLHSGLVMNQLDAHTMYLG